MGRSSLKRYAWKAYQGVRKGGGGSTAPDPSPVIQTFLAATTTSAARAAIGAGTSTIAIGTTALTAAAGNHVHASSVVTTVAIGTIPSGSVLSTLQALETRLAALEARVATLEGV